MRYWSRSFEFSNVYILFTPLVEYALSAYLDCRQYSFKKFRKRSTWMNPLYLSLYGHLCSFGIQNKEARSIRRNSLFLRILRIMFLFQSEEFTVRDESWRLGHVMLSLSWWYKEKIVPKTKNFIWKIKKITIWVVLKTGHLDQPNSIPTCILYWVLLC